ncbi:gluconate 2-dehydrogenase subunit 3 family protein [Halodurantibacterium flavum]|uniref:Gluconate 2-dehydrogenase subunit 3 family protein n=1 Tax=Halodurantibacterium flavum TaxID=1382802 RepID=A0ABW4RZ90_9RHOB
MTPEDHVQKSPMTGQTTTGHSGPISTTRRGFLGAGAAGMALGALPAPLWAQADVPPLEQYEPEFLTAPEWAFVLAAVARIIPSEGEGPGAIEARVPVFIDRQLAGPFGQAAEWYMEGPHDPDADPDFGYQTPLTPAEIYRAGIARFDEWCVAEYGAGFAELTPELQDAALEALEADAERAEEALGPAAGEGEEATGETAASPEGQGGEGAEGGDDNGGEGGEAGEEGEAGTTDAGEGEAGAGEGEEEAAPPAPRIMPNELREFFAMLIQNTKEGYFADPQYGGNHQMASWVYIGFPGARASFLEWVDKDNIPYPLGPVSISGERA